MELRLFSRDRRDRRHLRHALLAISPQRLALNRNTNRLHRHAPPKSRLQRPSAAPYSRGAHDAWDDKSDRTPSNVGDEQAPQGAQR